MLQIAPDSDLRHALGTQDDDSVFCAACGHLVSRGRFRLRMNGGHEHAFTNPAGYVFPVVCYKEAPGAGSTGDPTEEHTWFPGFGWRVVHCRGCTRHLGWQFSGTSAPAVFFGLIKPRLSTVKP